VQRAVERADAHATPVLDLPPLGLAPDLVAVHGLLVQEAEGDQADDLASGSHRRLV
jgi:hypothetical protein